MNVLSSICGLRQIGEPGEEDPAEPDTPLVRLNSPNERVRTASTAQGAI